MPYIEEEIGGCCGITAYCDFGVFQGNYEAFSNRIDEIASSSLEDYDEGYIPPRKSCIVVIITLTDQQINNRKHLVEYLKKKGFKINNRFKNRNSGNIVNVFSYTKNPISRRAKDLPFEW